MTKCHRMGIALFVLLLASTGQAQTATPQNHFGWTETGQTPAAATAATYKLYEGTTPLGTLTNVTCVASGADADCTGDIPALIQGTHTVTLTQNSQGAESPKSNAVSFTFVIVIVPTSFRVK